jgi:hypothetical protein
MQDPHLSNGYGYWRGSQYQTPQPIVGVYLTDPSHPEGLGDYQEFREMAREFDVVAHTEMQSVRMEAIRRLSGGVGKIAMADGTMTDATYLSALLDSHPNVVDLAPAVDPLSDEPIDDGGRALQAVRDAVITQGIDQKDPNDPDARYLLTDYVYANTAQWHQIMSAGLIGDGYYLKHGRPMTSMLVVAPFEHGDLGRKLVVSGLPTSLAFPNGVTINNPDMLFARQEYAEDVNAGSYALALDRGYVPREAFRGAAY